MPAFAEPTTATADRNSGAPPGGRPADPPPGKIPLRSLGRANAKVSALGLGGHHIGDPKSVEEAIAIVHAALDGGITFFDNCWEYYNGKTENWLGRALEGRREQAFLMTKVCTHGRDAGLALRMLEESLIRLRTDHLDLWQVHGVGFDNDPELAYAQGGVLEALDKAKQQGKTRFVGFTGHKDPAVHLKMITLGYPFDTVQMPLNPFDFHFRSFEKIVLPEAQKRGIAVLGMKSMGGTAEAVKRGVITPEELLRYAMSLPVAVTISGCDTLAVLHKNLKIAQGFTPLTPAQMDDLRRRCAETAADGRFEPYKVSLKFDNPCARLPHGFPIDLQQKEVKQFLERGTGTWSPQ
ncbi:MAG TPA: aldo/keto reductase [Pirellulales bacterium]|jgi:aryl-alcohol dehydrogenase-like predicted oxidoreductase|nr:aldo/keto reductase [Pirellulales bacterium]